MGRHKKYSTTEEKLEANRAKSKKYYQKSKDKINDQRRKAYYRKKHPKNKAKIADTVRRDKKTNEPQAAIWLEEARRLKRRLDKHVANNAITFLDSLCTTYLDEGNHDIILEHMRVFDNLQRLIYRYQDKILQIDGVGDIWKEADSIKQRIVQVLSWIQDIYSTALIDINDEFSESYSKQQFVFQESHQ